MVFICCTPDLWSIHFYLKYRAHSGGTLFLFTLYFNIWDTLLKYEVLKIMHKINISRKTIRPSFYTQNRIGPPSLSCPGPLSLFLHPSLCRIDHKNIKGSIWGYGVVQGAGPVYNPPIHNRLWSKRNMRMQYRRTSIKHCDSATSRRALFNLPGSLDDGIGSFIGAR